MQKKMMVKLYFNWIDCAYIAYSAFAFVNHAMLYIECGYFVDLMLLVTASNRKNHTITSDVRNYQVEGLLAVPNAMSCEVNCVTYSKN